MLVRDEQYVGDESAYYNAEINPWCHVTFDLQSVEPAIRARDTALVLGMRAKIDF